MDIEEKGTEKKESMQTGNILIIKYIIFTIVYVYLI